MQLEVDSEIKFIPLTESWVSLIWPLIQDDIDSIPKSWPKTKEELAGWALGTRRQQTIADRSIILLKSDQSNEFIPVGLITGDLVRGLNSENFPGAQLGDVNIAYMIFKSFRGKGLAQRALIQISKSWKEDGKNPILRIADDNIASKSVAIKAGFQLKEQSKDSGRVLGLYALNQ